MSVSVALTKRGGACKSYLKRNLETRMYKERCHCNLKGTLKRKFKGTFKSQFKSNLKIKVYKELKNRSLKITLKL